MAASTEPESKSKTANRRRLRNSGMLFVWAAKLGFFALLYFLGLLVASILVSTPHVLWMICFLLSLLALCGHVAAWWILSYRSKGYGISGSFLYWEYWLLVMGSGVSALFAFRSYQRYLVLFLLAVGIWVSLQFFRLLWTVPVRALSRSVKLTNRFVTWR